MTTSYVQRVYQDVAARNPDEGEFLQAVKEVLTSIEPALEDNPQFERHAILERMVEPDRMIKFRIAWVDDQGTTQVNRGYRVEFNNAIGPYKGGLRFHSSVTASILKFLGFEQTFKNALTGLWMGGGKGGSDFDTHGKSEGEVMRFCQAFMTELYRHIGPNTDIPAGDIGVGGREVGYMYGQYKRIMNEFTGVLTGKGLAFGGSLGRTEATGYGLLYYTDEVLKTVMNDSLEGKKVTISGSGNVSIYAAEKTLELGGRVHVMSDSSGYIYDPEGIDLDLIKEIKLARRERISAYTDTRKKAEFSANKKVWERPCDIALPCATQNELDEADAKQLIAGGVKLVAEGANMPSTPQAIEAFRTQGVIFAPGKASNAGGVAVSGLEMTQDSMRLAWTFEETDARLQGIMKQIVADSLAASNTYGLGHDLLMGANLAGFVKVAHAMVDQGVF
ncbi:MAG: NADP-specific glutamate dehydrogenase [Propionibacteriaceae bacterium]|nr:NADP-specific glutamate dehydrogenase [Propionibacteriaceae bacterium]